MAAAIAESYLYKGIDQPDWPQAPPQFPRFGSRSPTRSIGRAGLNPTIGDSQVDIDLGSSGSGGRDSISIAERISDPSSIGQAEKIPRLAMANSKGSAICKIDRVALSVVFLCQSVQTLARYMLYSTCGSCKIFQKKLEKN